MEHPFPADIADLQGAMVACIMANAHRDPKASPSEVKDFLIMRERKSLQQGKQMSEAERMRAGIMGG